MLQIGIDARPATTEARGLRTYSRSLLRELAAKDRGVKLTLYTHDAKLYELLSPSSFCSIHLIPEWTPIKTHTLLPRLVRRQGIQVMAFLANSAWMFPSCPTVVTIHDLTSELFPSIFYPTLGSRMLRLIRQRFFFRPKLVITISETSRKQILEHFKISPTRVQVVFNGVNGIFQPEQPLGPGRSRFQRLKPYLLYVGALDFRKNLETLLAAFAWLKGHTDLPHRLILAGNSDPTRPALYPDLRTLARKLGIEQQVDFLGYVADEELPSWYRHAALFVFPSLYEGFGLPPLEAMASGVPVVCSHAASLPEVVGDAGILVDARDAHALAGAIQRVLEDPVLAQELRARGLARAQHFTWEKTADQWVACIRSLLSVPA